MQLASLTIAGTSTSKTYEPTSSDGNLSTWKERSGGIPVGFPTITGSLREPANAGGNYKTVFRIKIPVLEVAAGSVNGFEPAPTKAYDLTANVEVILPDRSTSAQRLELKNQLVSLVSSSVFTALAVNLEQVY